MLELQKAQEAIYQALRASGAEGSFLRLSRDDQALWVTDLPRRRVPLDEAEALLNALNVECALDERTGLWRLNWTLAGWMNALASLPTEPPALPKEDELHPAYALCRLLLFHPAPLERQPMERLCQMAKLAQGPREALMRSLPACYGDAAARLRLGQPLPSAAGRILASWLKQAAPKSKEAER